MPQRLRSTDAVRPDNRKRKRDDAAKSAAARQRSSGISTQTRATEASRANRRSSEHRPTKKPKRASRGFDFLSSDEEQQGHQSRKAAPEEPLQETQEMIHVRSPISLRGGVADELDGDHPAAEWDYENDAEGARRSHRKLSNMQRRRMQPVVTAEEGEADDEHMPGDGDEVEVEVEVEGGGAEELAENSHDREPIGDLTIQAVLEHARQLQAEGAPDEDEEPPEAIANIRKRVASSSKKFQRIAKSTDRISDLLRDLKQEQESDSDEFRGYWHILQGLVTNLKLTEGITEEDETILYHLDNLLPEMWALRDGARSLQDSQKRVSRRLQTHLNNIEKSIRVIRNAMLAKGYQPHQDDDARRDFEEELRLNQELARRKNAAIWKFLRKRDEQRARKRERIRHESTPLDYDFDQFNYVEPKVVGGDGEIEIVEVEGFGERRMREQRMRIQKGLIRESDVLEDRPWTNLEIDAVIHGIEKWRGADRYRLIKENFSNKLKHRSLSDIREQAVYIRGEFVDADVPLGGWWDNL